MSLTGDERIEFQSGDAMGYYHPPRMMATGTIMRQCVGQVGTNVNALI